MGNELAYLTKIASDTQYLKALVGRIAASSGVTAATTPTVDFCCDFFDRPDSDSLGSYWADATGSWSLYGGVAVPRTGVAYQAMPVITNFTQLFTLAGSASIVTGAAGFVFSSATGSNVNAIATTAVRPAINFAGTHQTAIQNMYSANITSPDMTVKVTFVARKSAVATSSYSASGNRTLTWNAYSPAVFGAAVGNAAAQNVGVAGAFCSAPTQVTSGGTWAGSDGSASFSGSVPAASTGAIEFMQAEFGNFGSAFSILTPSVAAPNVEGTTIVTPGTGSVIYDVASGYSVQATGLSGGATIGDIPAQTFRGYSGASSPVVDGVNTLTMQVLGTRYVVDINGTVLVNQLSPLVLNRTKVGLAAYAYDLFTASAGYGYTGVGIKSFKAWIGTMPEPPDQSGYGSFAAGALSYRDKYHITASNGTVTYNPLA